ncbi:Nucleolar GTP-binding protein 2 [Giardia duodenalis assemblage B]|uniref:Nucleolar GTP-binding protein 2 n=1 Tax=Giardia duodenalis assemblage B TaxID=1394984 RepID=A0A132P066_GIAIN|nr:Nucleolar GTP-binding protein 2 [Giardia intestinalis assemblage B]
MRLMVSSASSIVGRKTAKKGNIRTTRTIKRLKMYNTRPVRDERGKILHEQYHNPTAQLDGRIEPSRNWFGNTRVVGQQDLAKMREVIANEEHNPNTFLVRNKRLPTALIHDVKQETVKIQEIEPYHLTFGPKAQRKRSKLSTFNAEEILSIAQGEVTEYDINRDGNTVSQRDLRKTAFRTEYDPRLVRGQTNRIYSEIYKVIDSSDVIIYVLDARDPEGTRSRFLERYMTTPENEHRHMIYLLNKCDLVPTWVTASWISKLSKIRPTIAFHASIEHPFGRNEVFSILRQFAQLHRDKAQISVGFCGYPNTGKSSVINTLLGKHSCKTAPVPGETKVWQYVSLTKRINLIDAPGVVWATNQLELPNELRDLYNTGTDISQGRATAARSAIDDFNYINTTDIHLVLSGVLRAEYLEFPEKFIPCILQRVKPEYINKTYNIRPASNVDERWDGDVDKLLEILSFKQGRLLKGGEPDTRTVARRILEDFIRGRIPHFVIPYTQEEVDEYKATIGKERKAWGNKTDVELINYVNTQDLMLLPKTLNFNEEEIVHDAFAINNRLEEVSEPEQEEIHGTARPVRNVDDIDNNSESGEVSLSEKANDWDSVFGQEDTPACAASKEHRSPDTSIEKTLTVGERVAAAQAKEVINVKTKSKRHYGTSEGVKRAVKLLRTKNRELTRAYLSGVVGDNDLVMVSGAYKKQKTPKRNRGGYDHGKTGSQFYANIKARSGSKAGKK